MRIAYTLNGLIGGFGNTKTYDINNYGDESSLTLRYVSKYLKKYVLKNNDVIFLSLVGKLISWKNLKNI